MREWDGEEGGREGGELLLFHERWSHTMMCSVSDI